RHARPPQGDVARAGDGLSRRPRALSKRAVRGGGVRALFEPYDAERQHLYAGACLPFALTLDRVHVVVGKTEVMADLVDQYMAHDVAQALVMLGPVVQDGTA